MITDIFDEKLDRQISEKKVLGASKQRIKATPGVEIKNKMTQQHIKTIQIQTRHTHDIENIWGKTLLI